MSWSGFLYRLVLVGAALVLVALGASTMAGSRDSHGGPPFAPALALRRF